MSKTDKKQSIMTRQFKSRYIVVPLLVIIAGASIFAGIKIYQNKKIVRVATVSSAASNADMMGGDEVGQIYYGSLKKGSVVSVKADQDLTIEKVNVKKGDTVKKGDVVITYETHSLEDSIADAELMVKTLTNDITIVQNELDILTRLQPSENKPEEEPEEEEPEEEETDSDTDSSATPDAPKSKFEATITERSMPLGGSGKENDPLIYMVGTQTVVSKEALAMLAQSEEPLYAALYVFSEDDEQLFTRVIDSSKIKSADKDFPVSDGVTITPDGSIAFSGGSFDFASFVTSAAAPQPGAMQIPEGFQMPENIEIPETPADTDVTEYEISFDDHYLYSLQELKDMIAAREKQKAALELNKRQAELSVKVAKHRAETGGETAPIDGTVSFVAKDKYHLSESGAYLTITNDSGMSVMSSVGEFSLDSLSVGNKVTVENFENGARSNGEIIEISDTPSAQLFGDAMTPANDLESMYPFTVTLETEIELSEDAVVEIRVIPDDEEETLCLPAPLVRMESGRYFIMIANDEDKLEKRYVTIGSIKYGAIEILSGVTKEDRIAFPYGNAVEGADVVDASFAEMYYGSTMFGLI